MAVRSSAPEVADRCRTISPLARPLAARSTFHLAGLDSTARAPIDKEEQFGLKQLRVLIVTTSMARVANMIDIVN